MSVGTSQNLAIARDGDIWTPEWKKAVKHALVDRDLNMTEFSILLGLSRGHVCSVVSGSLRTPSTQQAISDYLNLTA